LRRSGHVASVAGATTSRAAGSGRDDRGGCRALVAGVGATWTVVEVGHSGAKATWKDVGDNVENDGGDNDTDDG
jgi:hypothetical protein